MGGGRFSFRKPGNEIGEHCCKRKKQRLPRQEGNNVAQRGKRYVLKDEAQAIQLLRDKAQQLNRTPEKHDFDNVLACKIKARLGPWPRALEKAGLKQVSQTYLDKKARQKEKAGGRKKPAAQRQYAQALNIEKPKKKENQK